jgi:outer membrane protein assembly factor BamB
MLPLALVGIILPYGPPSNAKPAKTVFRSQPSQWQPRMEGDGRAKAVSIAPSWTFQGFEAPFAGDPIVSDGTLVFASEDGQITGLEPMGGEVRWEVHLEDTLGVGPSGENGMIFQATRGGRLLALDAADGRALWSVSLGAEATHPPRLYGDHLVVGTADEELISIDARDGSVRVRRPLPGRPTTPPEPAPGAILIGTDHGMLLAYDLERLEPRWRFYGIHAISAPPLYHRKRVYVASADRSFRCLRSKNGKPLWTTRMGAVITARPFVTDRALYVLSYDNDIYLLKPKNGHLLTRVRLGHRLDVDAGLSNDHVFVVPFTEATLVGLALPALQIGGLFNLDIPGEWFTTAPVVLENGVALGYGRDAGRILMLSVTEVDETIEDDG